MFAARVLKCDTSHVDETLSRNKIVIKDANMGLAGRGGHITHVSMSWTHVHNAVEMSRFSFSRRIRNCLAFWSPLRACAAFTLSANYLLVVPAIMHEYLLKLLSPFSSYFQIPEHTRRDIPDMVDRLDVDRCHWCCLLVSVILSGYKLRIHVKSATCVIHIRSVILILPP